jgi:hypothetical protein
MEHMEKIIPFKQLGLIFPLINSILDSVEEFLNL